jgi:uncharacterized membrane protein HdeD (DUF308 family)
MGIPLSAMRVRKARKGDSPMAGPALRGDASDMLGRLGRHWGWMMAFGIITVLAGILVLAWPGPTLLVLAVLFGFQLVVLGVFRFVAAFEPGLTAGARILYALLGVLSLIIGLYALRHVLITILALGLLLGIFWVANGAVELFTALSHREVRHRAWTSVLGLLSILAGLVLLVYPGLSLVALAVIVGVWLLVFGFMEISVASRARSAGHHQTA